MKVITKKPVLIFTLALGFILLIGAAGCQSNQPTAAPESADPSWSKVERSGVLSGWNLLRVSSL